MKRIFALILICIFLFSALSLSACKKGGSESAPLSATIVGDTLVWESYPGAAYYTVEGIMSDGSGYRIKLKESPFTLPHNLPGTYSYNLYANDSSGGVLAEKHFDYHIGSGSAADPILIGSADALLAIKGSREVTYGDTTAEAPLYYKMTRDIDLTGRELTPIGELETPFRGVFDGDGHKITGASFKDGKSGIIGLFGAIRNAVIRNVTLEGASMLCDKDSGVSGNYNRFGLLVGFAQTSFLDNCHVKGTIDLLSGVNTSGKNSLYAGGIVGRFESGLISSCSFEGSIKAQYSCVFTGGIAGLAQGASPLYFSMTNCRVNADVKGTATGYNVNTGTVKGNAIARVGVLAGSIITAARLSSLLAIGTATAKGRDGADPDEVTAGVFGLTPTTNSTNAAPIYDLFYLDTISQVAGNVNKLGAYADRVFPLSESALKAKSSYFVKDEEDTLHYGLDFDGYWTLTEGQYPALTGRNGTVAPPSVEIEITSDASEERYRFTLEEVLLPTLYQQLLVNGKRTNLHAYRLNTLLSTLGVTLPTGSGITLRAEGIEPIEITVTEGKPDIYLTYAENLPIEKVPTRLENYRLVVFSSDAFSEIYELNGLKKLTITVTPPVTE